MLHVASSDAFAPKALPGNARGKIQKDLQAQHKGTFAAGATS